MNPIGDKKDLLADSTILKRKTSKPETQMFSVDGATTLPPEFAKSVSANDVVKELTRKPERKYTFHQSVGVGGMKSVLQMRDKDTARDIAMAVLLDKSDDKLRENIPRFVQEARITANLEHPNIVPVHDIGVDAEGMPYFTMKLVKGQSLAEILKKLSDGDQDYLDRYDQTHLLLIFRKICNAIGFAHSKGVVHLDITPENIQVGEFGEVQVLDWGLAKVIDVPSQEETTVGRFAGGIRESEKGGVSASIDKTLMTMDGVIKGTPGYMAPEQAAGENSKKNQRTDIYALGAILYSMLTFKQPLEGENVNSVLEDTMSGNIIPPSQRAEDRVVPAALEAVAMKAMAVNTNERYGDVLELRNDVDAFIGGFATSAEGAGILKKNLLFVKRHRLVFILSTVIFFLLLTLARYASHDYAKQTRDWRTVFAVDFSSEPLDPESWMFLNRLMSHETSSWSFTPNLGLQVRRLEWLWLRDAGAPGNVRVKLDVVYEDDVDAMEVYLNSHEGRLSKWWNAPRGYAFKFAMNGGSKCAIAKIGRTREFNVVEMIEPPVQAKRSLAVTFQRRDGVLTMFMNGRRLVETVDLFPPIDNRLRRVGLRSQSRGLYLKSIEVSRLALPEKASPLIAGDALMEAGHFDQAIEKYLTIAENYGDSPIAAKALTKAYQTAATKLDDERGERIKRKIKSLIDIGFPNFPHRAEILKVDCLHHWRARRYARALELLDQLTAWEPSNHVAKLFLQGEHHPLPKDVGLELLSRLAAIESNSNLNLSNLGLTSLEPITGMSLKTLDCSDNDLVDLSPLADMPLRELDVSGNDVESLTPLENLPLETLNLSRNPVKDLSPLSAMSLKSINLDGCGNITDFSPLTNIPTLETLKLPKNAKTDAIIKTHPGLKRRSNR